VSTAALVVALVSGCAGGDRSLSAADKVPALGTGLARVDAALAAHQFTAARKDLRELRTEVVRARKTGALDAADAVRVLDSISRLLATIPTGSSGPTTGPVPSTASSSHSPRPSHKASSTTPSATPSATSPAPTPSSTPTTSSTPSPTSSGSANPSPSPGAISPTP
jgi:hypothetical protein